MLVTLGIVVALAMTFLSGPIVHLMYGPAYATSAGALRILIWSGIPVCFGVAWANWMILEGRAKMLFYFQLSGAIVNIILNLILIPRLGIAGSALATLALILVRNYTSRRPHKAATQRVINAWQSNGLISGSLSRDCDDQVVGPARLK